MEAGKEERKGRSKKGREEGNKDQGSKREGWKFRQRGRLSPSKHESLSGIFSWSVYPACLRGLRQEGLGRQVQMLRDQPPHQHTSQTKTV